MSADLPKNSARDGAKARAHGKPSPMAAVAVMPTTRINSLFLRFCRDR
jgi:hypothetical protein